MSTTTLNTSYEQDRTYWERHARLISAAWHMESVARSGRVAEMDAVEMMQEAAELRAMARTVPS